MDLVLALLLGVGLAAASGLRVFLPLFALGLAARFGEVPLGSDFLWLASTEALLALGVATLVEVAGYYVPLVDHLLDTITSPAGVVAGTLATAAVLTGVTDPVIKWGLAIVAGGGAAGAVQAGTVVLRAASTATTAGAGNPVVATIEWVGAILLTLAAIIAPVLVIIGVLALLDVFRRQLRKWRKPAWE